MGINAGLGKAVASVPTSKVMDVYNAMAKVIGDSPVPNYLYSTVNPNDARSVQRLPRVQGRGEGSSALSGRQRMKVSGDSQCTVVGGGNLFCCRRLSHSEAGSPQQGFDCICALARSSSVDFICSV